LIFSLVTTKEGRGGKGEVLDFVLSSHPKKDIKATVQEKGTMEGRKKRGAGIFCYFPRREERDASGACSLVTSKRRKKTT